MPCTHVVGLSKVKCIVTRTMQQTPSIKQTPNGDGMLNTVSTIRHTQMQSTVETRVVLQSRW